jgi:hypothetical protein
MNIWLNWSYGQVGSEEVNVIYIYKRAIRWGYTKIVHLAIRVSFILYKLYVVEFNSWFSQTKKNIKYYVKKPTKGKMIVVNKYIESNDRFNNIFKKVVLQLIEKRNICKIYVIAWIVLKVSLNRMKYKISYN